MIVRSKWVAKDGSVANVPHWFTGYVWREPVDPSDEERLNCRITSPIATTFKEYKRQDFYFPESEGEALDMKIATVMRRSAA